MAQNGSKTSTETPVRGSLRLTVTTSSTKVGAGSDFSIFVIIQNPFDIPITIYQVQTHIPIELIDVNGARLDWARRENELKPRNIFESFYKRALYNIEGKTKHTGIAIALGTDFDPLAEKELFNVSTNLQNVAENATANIVGVLFQFPENPTSDELDRIFKRLSDYKKGLIPVQLQPGDSVVKQFVLRTREWLFFTPLTHKFQIQVNYASDGVDHTDTISYEQSIQSTIGAMAVGAAIGAIVGTSLKSLSSPAQNGTDGSILRVLTASLLASMAVVVAFARKSTAQPLVSVEDFWGGALIGFSVGFFGFEQFFNLFNRTE